MVVVVDIQSELITESVSENISDTQKYDNHSNKLKDLSKQFNVSQRYLQIISNFDSYQHIKQYPTRNAKKIMDHICTNISSKVMYAGYVLCMWHSSRKLSLQDRRLFGWNTILLNCTKTKRFEIQMSNDLQLGKFSKNAQ